MKEETACRITVEANRIDREAPHFCKMRDDQSFTHTANRFRTISTIGIGRISTIDADVPGLMPVFSVNDSKQKFSLPV